MNNAASCLFVCTVFAAILPLYDTSETVSRSGVCERLESANETTCMQQLQPFVNASEDCIVKFFRNYQGCSQLNFPTGTKSEPEDDIVELKSYYYDNKFYQRTAFNITLLRNRKWKDVVMRFQQLNGHNEGSSACIQLTLSSDVDSMTLPWNLFFDCLWALGTYEGTVYQMDVWETLTKKHWNYRFRVPENKNINPGNQNITSWEIFMYLHISLLPRMVFTFQELPETFQIQHYNVDLRQLVRKSSVVVDKKILRSHRKQLLRRVEFDIPKDAGTYFYTVKGKCKDPCDSQVVQSLKLELKENTLEGILAGVIFAAVVLLIICFIFLLLWKNYMLSIWARIKRHKPPQVLIVYKPTSSEHCHFVETLAKYLQKGGCHVDPLLDLWHIRKSETQDPYLWIVDSVEKAEYIMVIASSTPHINQKQTTHESDRPIYRSTYELAVACIKNTIPKELAAVNETQIKNKCFVAIPPYATIHDVPTEARLLKQFHLMNDFNQMLYYIHKVHLRKLITVRHFFPAVTVSHGGSELGEEAELRRELLSAMQTAENVTVKHNKREGRQGQKQKPENFNKFEKGDGMHESKESNYKIEQPVEMVEGKKDHENLLLPQDDSMNTDHFHGTIVTGIDRDEIDGNENENILDGEKCDVRCMLSQHGPDGNDLPELMSQQEKCDESVTFGDYLPCVSDLLSVTCKQYEVPEKGGQSVFNLKLL